MSLRPGLIGLVMLCWAGATPAQAPVVYTSPEGDFRALFPAAPVRTTMPDGAVAYSAAVEETTFTVYRRDPRKQPIGNPAADIQQRLRGHDDDKVVRRLGKDDGEARRDEFAFQVGSTVSIHRLFVADNRYYEAVVRAPRGEIGRARGFARDFFGSFQIGSAVVAPGAQASVTPDVLCKGRSNAFSRTYCEYSNCLRSQHRAQPYCQKLLSFR